MRYVVFDIETANTFPGLARSIDRLEISIVGVYDSQNDAYTSYVKEEFAHLWPIIEKADMLIGFNSDQFDIPLLNRYYPGDLTSIRSLDLLAEVYRSLGRRVRLGSLAEATLGRGKSGDGLKAVEWWNAGLVDKVREYCLDDVRITKELYDYAHAHGTLKYKDFKNFREIKIDTSAWDKIVRAPTLTHALPL